MMPGGWLFLRSRKVLVLLACIGTTALTLSAISGMLLESLVTADWASVPLLSAAVLPGVVWAIIGVSPGRALERALPGSRILAYRLALFVLVTAAFMLVAVAVVVPRPVMETEPAAVYRNVLFGMGAGAMSAAVLPRHIAWAPLLSYAVLNWTIGTSTPWGTARAWALLNAHADPWPAPGVTVVVFVLGAVMYALFDGRGSR